MVKTDPGPTNRQSFYFARGANPKTMRTEEGTVALLPGRRGACESDMKIVTTDTETTISLHGWFKNTLTLNDRQAAFLFRTLSQFITLDD